MLEQIPTYKKFRKLLNLQFVFLATLIIFSMTSTAYAQEPVKAPSKYLTITPQAGNHLVGETVTISGKYVDSTEKFIEEFITIRIFDLETPTGIVEEVYFKEIFSKHGRFQDAGFKPIESGNYLVVAESETKTTGKFTLEIVNFHSTISFVVLLIATISFAILMSIVAKISSRSITVAKFRVARFTLISIIVFSMIGFFVFSNMEYGTNSVVGIILVEQVLFEETQKALAEDKPPPLKLDWVLHFGGHPGNDPTDDPTELNIPIYIMIFGVLGGYLRFFYFTTGSWLRTAMLERLDGGKEKFNIYKDDGTIDEDQSPEEIEDKNRKLVVIYDNADKGIFSPTLNTVLITRVMSDLSLLFIAPVLAVMMFFVLSQAGLNQTEHFFTFAVTSFIAGLFTENVIQKLKEKQEKGELIPDSKDSSNESKEKSTSVDTIKTVEELEKKIDALSKNLAVKQKELDQFREGRKEK